MIEDRIDAETKLMEAVAEAINQPCKRCEDVIRLMRKRNHKQIIEDLCLLYRLPWEYTEDIKEKAE